MADGTVLHRLENGISYITLNRPDAGNALLQIQRPVIRGLLQAASDDCEIRGVVLAANGKHFCTGAGLRTGASGADKPRPAGDIARQLRSVRETTLRPFKGRASSGQWRCRAGVVRRQGAICTSVAAPRVRFSVTHNVFAAVSSDTKVSEVAVPSLTVTGVPATMICGKCAAL